MSTTSTDSQHDIDASQESRRQMLMLARRLDRFGLQAEQFLSRQLEQLERAIDEFESEKAAWRRQFQRETSQLAHLREDVPQSRERDASGLTIAVASELEKRVRAESTARKSGGDPLRILLQPGQATSMQVGLLMFEISKLNRDMGGQGIRFEVDEIRVPKRRFLSWKSSKGMTGKIIELTAYSTLPLAARGRHVALDVDITDRLEDWIAFKLRLLQSSLVNENLATVFSAGRATKCNDKSRSGFLEATRHVAAVTSKSTEHSDYSGTAMLANSASDVIQQQAARLENCYDCLCNDCGLRLHIELHAMR